jgi:hypothetical protein
MNLAFFVGSSAATLPINSAGIAFDTVVININGPYDAATGQLTSVQQAGIYWLQLSAGATAFSGSNTRLNGLTYPFVVYSTTSNYPGDVMVTDTIQSIDSTMQLSVTNQVCNTYIHAYGNLLYSSSASNLNSESQVSYLERLTLSIFIPFPKPPLFPDKTKVETKLRSRLKVSIF